MNSAIVLVDMDGVIADFHEGFLTEWRARYPNAFYVPTQALKSWYIEDHYPPELHPLMRAVYTLPGFFLDLPPIPGSVQALLEMQRLIPQVYICTTPLSGNPNCPSEKYAWVECHLGTEWTKRLILCEDKTLILGGILIDDKPEVTGNNIPIWEHIVFDRPYNQNTGGDRRRLRGWHNWRSLL